MATISNPTQSNASSDFVETLDLEQSPSASTDRKARPRKKGRLSALADDPDLAQRFDRLKRLGGTIRSSEYHLTNACNIRCEGCWFFAYDFDKQSHEASDLAVWNKFAKEQATRGVTAALLIGGEPTLYLDRVSSFVEAMEHVTISSNGLKPFPIDGFEDVAVALTLFGGSSQDDRMRAIKPNGDRFSGLFGTALENYKNDPRATFIYALDELSPESIEPTIRRIADNGNLVSFNYYTPYGLEAADAPADSGDRLTDEAIRVAELFPETVLSHPYYIRALISGKTEWGEFGYDSCPSISVDNPVHYDRVRNGNPVLPGFNAYSADTEKLSFCCTSGHCEGCRDSQAVHSWLMTNVRKFMRMEGGIRLWVEVSESYWKQFVWSDLHPSKS